MNVGDRVMLRPDLARQRTINCKGRAKKVDWRKRWGTVASVGRRDNANAQLGITWNGGTWIDYWPERALVLAPAKVTDHVD